MLALSIGLALLIYSCTKSDQFLRPTDGRFTNIEQHFFQKMPGADPVMDRVMAAMKIINTSNQYWERFGKTNGLPVWNKTINLLGNTNATNFSSAGAGRDTIFYIPMVLPGDSIVNGFIMARIRDSIQLKYCLAEDYPMYGYAADNRQSDVIQFTTKLIALNNLVFNYTNFKLNDTKLYSSDTSFEKVNKIAMSITQSNLLSTTCVTSTFTPYFCGSTNSTYCTGPNGCDYEACHGGNTCYALLTIVTQENCMMVDNGVWDPVGNTGTTTSSTSGTGSIPHYTPPCTSQTATCPLPIPGGPVTAVHVNDPPTASGPCDPMITLLKNDVNFIAKFKELGSQQNLTKDVETGYIVQSLSGNLYEPKTGDLILNGTAAINWGVLSGINGTIHCHYINRQEMFSPIDMISLAVSVLNNEASDRANVFVGINTNSGPYLLKVTNLPKFLLFANKIAGTEKKKRDFFNNYKDQFVYMNDKTRNEMEFLQMMKFIGGYNPGVTLYRGNTDCNSWTALSYEESANGTPATIGTQPCN